MKKSDFVGLSLLSFFPNFFIHIAGIFYIEIFKWKTFGKFERNYGEFIYSKKEKKLDFVVNNESKIFYGEIIKTILDLKNNPKRVLLTGEDNRVKEKLRSRLKIKLFNSEIVTTGLDKKVDYKWNFEKDPPQMGKFSLIISQAMLEHLVNPYKHIKDLSLLLEKKGVLIVHTELPGFMYHRYPVDTLRFHPDWFEEIAKPFRCNLKIFRKYLRNFHIFYVYQK